jgi:hypothetical protein
MASLKIYQTSLEIPRYYITVIRDMSDNPRSDAESLKNDRDRRQTAPFIACPRLPEATGYQTKAHQDVLPGPLSISPA